MKVSIEQQASSAGFRGDRLSREGRNGVRHRSWRALVVGASFALPLVAEAQPSRFNNHDQSHADLCVRLRADTAHLRYPDGTPTGFVLTTPLLVPEGGRGVWCPTPGMARLDAREIVHDAQGRPMLFHRGGWGFAGQDPASAVHYGHVLVADLDTIGLRYAKQPPGSEVPFDDRWSRAPLEPWIDQGQRDGNGSACARLAETPEYVVVRSIPSDMRYLNTPRTNAIRYAIYGNPSEDLGPAEDRARGIRYTMLSWSWVNVRGGGVARALVQDGAPFRRCLDVPPIRLASVADVERRRETGWVEAVYGAVQDGRGAWLHGWLVAAHRHGDGAVERHLR